MEELQENKRTSYTFQKWCEYECDSSGKNYTIKICTNQNAKKNGELGGKTILKEILLTNEEFEILKESLVNYKFGEIKFKLMAFEKYAPDTFSHTLDSIKSWIEWCLNKCVENIRWIPRKSKNKNCFNKEFNPSKEEVDIFNDLYNTFSKKYRFTLNINNLGE